MADNKKPKRAKISLDIEYDIAGTESAAKASITNTVSQVQHVPKDRTISNVKVTLKSARDDRRQARLTGIDHRPQRRGAA